MCLCACVTAALRVGEPVVSNGWTVNERTTGNVQFTLALQQQGLDKIVQVATEVSDPRSPTYTNYLVAAEVEALTAPLPQDVSVVTSWLKENNIEYTFMNQFLIDVDTPVAQAEKLFNTSWSRLANAKTGQEVHRATAFTIPTHVERSIEAVFSVHGLPLPPKTQLRAHVAAKEPFKVTPDVINTKYGITGVTPKGSTTNVQAVAEFQGQDMVPKNLKQFFKKFLPSEPESSSVVSKFVGDKNDPSNEGVEADLDIQYIMGIAPGVNTEFWEEKGQDFCKDLVKWTSLLLSDTAPSVNSVSYGWQGAMTQIQCLPNEWHTVDSNFAKLAAMGISVIFASGDSGSGEASNTADAGKKLWPSWPASSVWVTAVGATRFVDQKPTEAEMATDQFGSGGGFSSMIDRSNATWQDKFVKNYLNIASKLPPAAAFTSTGRATPDVSGLGEGYQVFDGQVKPDSVGGTSASTPMFAGVVSLLNEAREQKGMKRLGFLNPFLYQNAAAFTDVTVGTNAIGRDGEKLSEGFACEKGWDPATGLGTPIFSALLAAATGGPVPPSPPPSPSPPGPPSPPSPPPPSPSPPGPTTHYEDPNAGPCQKGETAIQITGVKGSFCSPKCGFLKECSKDVPPGTTAKPECVLEASGSSKPTDCALICVPAALDSGCPAKASCKAISGTGLCTYDN